MSDIYLDIETIPSQEQWVRETIDVKPSASIKKQETLDKWYKEEYPAKLEEALSKTGFDGLTNHIICIGLAIDDQEPFTIYADDHKEEFNILGQFYHILSKEVEPFGNIFIGHNVLNFDLSVLKKRSIILGVEPITKIPFDARPWDNSVFDTMLKWDAKNFTSQDKIARALGIDRKTSIDGSMIYQYWKDGRHHEIAEYCKDDVTTVREIHKRMKAVC